MTPRSVQIWFQNRRQRLLKSEETQVGSLDAGIASGSAFNRRQGQPEHLMAAQLAASQALAPLLRGYGLGGFGGSSSPFQVAPLGSSMLGGALPNALALLPQAVATGHVSLSAAHRLLQAFQQQGASPLALACMGGGANRNTASLAAAAAAATATPSPTAQAHVQPTGGAHAPARNAPPTPAASQPGPSKKTASVRRFARRMPARSHAHTVVMFACVCARCVESPHPPEKCACSCQPQGGVDGLELLSTCADVQRQGEVIAALSSILGEPSPPPCSSTPIMA